MNATAATERYNHLAMLFHWSIALFILFNLSVGFFMGDWERPLKQQVLALHFSCGFTVLGLALLRVFWRLAKRPPELDPQLRPWEKRTAHGVHAALYLLMFAMPITGWAFLSCHPISARSNIPVFNLFAIPPIMPLTRLPDAQQKYLHDVLVDIHSTGAWLLLALLALHVAGALKHQWLDGHRELERMGLGRIR